MRVEFPIIPCRVCRCPPPLRFPNPVECPQFNLTNAFAGNANQLSHFFERALARAIEAEPQPDGLPLARIQQAEQFRGLTSQVLRGDQIAGIQTVRVRQQFAEVHLAVTADRQIQRNHFRSEPCGPFHRFDRQSATVGQFVGVRLAAERLTERSGSVGDFADDFDHVDGNPDGAGLIRHGPENCLTHPPAGVSGKTATAAVVELFDRPHQSDVAFLNDVREGKAAAAVVFRHADHQAQIGANQPIFCVVRFRQ